MPDPDRFELFAFWRTSATYRVRVALNLKDLSAHERIVDIDAGEHRNAEFLAINPLGAIPALIDHQDPDAPPITQSLAILEFLEDTHPTPPLLPDGPHARARVRSLAGMLATDTHPLIVPRVRKYLAANANFDDAAWRAWQTNWFTTGLQAVERRLASESQTGTFCHGHSVTIADVCLASIVVVQRVFRINVHDIPNVDRIMANCENLDAFAKADPAAQVGAPQAT